jgi:hypothetical protein
MNIKIATYARHCIRAGQSVPESWLPDWWEADEEGRLPEDRHDYAIHEFADEAEARDWARATRASPTAMHYEMAVARAVLDEVGELEADVEND